MSIDRFFPHFHPLSGEQSKVPVYVSMTQIKEVQDFLLQYTTEEYLLAASIKLKDIPSEDVPELFPKQRLFPTKEGYTHRATVGKIYKLSLFDDTEHPKAFALALLIMLKTNHLIDVFKYKFDYQLLSHPIRYDDFLISCEVADIALTISDAFGEFKLAIGNVESTVIKRQDYEQQVLKTNALKGNDIKHEPLRNLYEKICAIFDNKKLFNKDEFHKLSSGKVNYKKIAEHIFWNELSENERKLFGSYITTSKEIDNKVDQASLNKHCKESNKRFNPYTQIANLLSEHHKKLVKKVALEASRK